MARQEKEMPPWLLGLVIAVFVFLALLLVFAVLGFGDDPVVESAGSLLG